MIRKNIEKRSTYRPDTMTLTTGTGQRQDRDGTEAGQRRDRETTERRGDKETIKKQ